MSEEKVAVDYTSCGSLNFMPSRKILKIAEMLEQAKKGSRESVVRKTAYEVANKVYNSPLDIKKMCDEDRNKIAEAIFLWVRDKIKYVNDPPGEYFQPAVETLEVGAGDCDDQAILLSSMLGSIGFEPIFVILPEHVYIELQQANGEQVPMDPIIKNAVFGELPRGMRDYLEERYGLGFEDYLRVPIGRHIIVTPTKEIVRTERPLQMAMHNEGEGAASYREGDYRTAKHRFLAAAKMYHEAGLHTNSEDIREGLFASSRFCNGWAHLTQMMHLILSHDDDHLSLLQSEISQARSSFKASRLYFEKTGNAGIAREIDAIATILGGYEETLLADFLRYTGDDEASWRHYRKAREIYEQAKGKTSLRGLVGYIERLLDSLSDYEGLSPGAEMRVEGVLGEKSAYEDLSAKFDISPEDLITIRDRLENARGDELGRELMRLSIEKGLPISILEAVFCKMIEVSLRVGYPDSGDRYGSNVGIHPEVMEQLGLRKIDRVRVISDNREGIVSVRALGSDEDKGTIKVNRMVREMLGVSIGDMVKIERVYLR